MANNIVVKDGAGTSRTLKTTDTADVHTPHHNVDAIAAGASADIGATTDAEATGNGSLIGLLKRLRTLLSGGLPAALTAGGSLKVALNEASTNALEVVGDAAEGAAAAGNPVLVGGRYDASARTLADGNAGAIALDAGGAVHIADGGNTITVDGTVSAEQNTHDSLNVNANVQQGDADVASGNPLYIQPGPSASFAAVQTTHDQFNANANLQVGNSDVANGNPVPVSDAGGALTVDGTVTANAGTGSFDVNLQDGGGTDLTSTTVGDDRALDVNLVQSVDLSASLASAIPAGDNIIGSASVIGATGADAFQVQGAAACDGAAAGNPLYVAGVATSGSLYGLAVDSSGHLQVDVASLSDGGNTISIDDGDGTLTVDGTVTADAGTGDFNVSLQDGGGTDLTSTGVGDDQALDVNLVQSVTLSASLASAIPAGTNTIGSASLASAIPAGANVIGSASLASAIPAGANVIGSASIIGDTGANALQIQGTAACDTAGAGNPLYMGGVASSGSIYGMQVDSSGHLQVDVLSGGGAGSQYAEDTGHSAGDGGTATLAVRKDTAGTLTDTDGDYTMLQTDADGSLRITGAASLISAIPAGANVIGSASLASAIPAGTNTIGSASLASAIPAGTNVIGSASLASAIPAGTNIIGSASVIGPTGADALHVQGAAACDGAAAGNPLYMGGVASSGSIYGIGVDSSGNVQTSGSVVQATHDNLNLNANVQQGDADVAAGNALYVQQGTSASFTVIQDTHDSINLNANVQQGDSDVADGNPLYVQPGSSASFVAIQATQDQFNCNANVQQGDSDIGAANALYVQPGTGASFIGIQATHDQFNVNANMQVGDADVAAGNPVYVHGPAAHDAAASGNPIVLGGVAEATCPAAVSDGDAVRAWFDTRGRLVVTVGVASTATATACYAVNQSDAALITGSVGLIIRIFDIVVSTGASGLVNFEQSDGSTRVFGPLSLAAQGGWSFNSAVGYPLTSGCGLVVSSSTGTGPLGIAVNYGTIPG
jgi:hypothetical protein